MASEFHFSTAAPDWVPDMPRDYADRGKIVDEVGVLQKMDKGNKYWKTLELIEYDSDGEDVRTGYYTETSGFQNKPLMLPPEVMEDLTQFAEGKIW